MHGNDSHRCYSSADVSRQSIRRTVHAVPFRIIILHGSRFNSARPFYRRWPVLYVSLHVTRGPRNEYHLPRVLYNTYLSIALQFRRRPIHVRYHTNPSAKFDSPSWPEFYSQNDTTDRVDIYRRANILVKCSHPLAEPR